MNEDVLDKMIQVAITNFYTLNKKYGKIALVGFNYEFPAHKALMRIAQMTSLHLEVPLYVEVGFFGRRRLRRKSNIDFKRLKTINEDYPTCNEFIYNIETAFECAGAFEEIYNSYYKKED